MPDLSIIKKVTSRHLPSYGVIVADRDCPEVESVRALVPAGDGNGVFAFQSGLAGNPLPARSLTIRAGIAVVVSQLIGCQLKAADQALNERTRLTFNGQFALSELPFDGLLLLLHRPLPAFSRPARPD